METPYEIADRIVNRENTALTETNREFWVARIAQSISVAVGKERERCAKIAEAYKADDPETVRNINYRLAIAARIRGNG